ncbi:adenosine deaminase [Roseomonas populi]|uniref:Adenine deaminase n=1 Tax=Roseomonas populi TaxID=3121582 RepID=A0ABT1X8K1_9PROT|nr:adenosine deaminase [Roseomonas pecuniae]MCR0984434.1 adenosine deaminase [Roseomonas pecuniae]
MFDAPISPFIAGLPKAELHMHLEGSLEPETIMRLAARNGVRIPYANAEELRAAYSFTDLQSFLDLFYLGLTVLQTGEDFYEMTKSYLDRAAQDRVRHAEVFISPQGHLRRGIAMGTVIDNILRAFDDARREHGMTGGLIAGIQRQFDEEEALSMLRELRPWRDRIIGLGTGGPERGNRPAKFRRAYAYAKHDLGWRTTIHAGEEGGSDFVCEAIDELHVDRIDHGVRSEADPNLMRRLAETGMPLTVCPCSNIMLRVFPDMAAHNIRRLHEAGLCLTVNSDDPSYFGAYVNENFASIQQALGFSDADLWGFARNSFLSAFLNEEDRARHLAELAAHKPVASPS